MSNKLLTLSLFLLVIALACSDNDSPERVPFDPGIAYEDLQDAWRGTLEQWRVENATDKPSYTLQGVDISLILDTDTYWLQLTYFSDTLEYQYFNRGFWLWDPSIPDVIAFELYQEQATQIFNPLRPGSNPDTTDGGGGGGGGNPGGGAPPDTIITAKGDNTKLEERFISLMDYNEESIRLYDFIEYLDFGDVTLERF